MPAPSITSSTPPSISPPASDSRAQKIPRPSTAIVSEDCPTNSSTLLPTPLPNQPSCTTIRPHPSPVTRHPSHRPPTRPAPPQTAKGDIGTGGSASGLTGAVIDSDPPHQHPALTCPVTRHHPPPQEGCQPAANGLPKRHHRITPFSNIDPEGLAALRLTIEAQSPSKARKARTRSHLLPPYATSLDHHPHAVSQPVSRFSPPPIHLPRRPDPSTPNFQNRSESTESTQSTTAAPAPAQPRPPGSKMLAPQSPGLAPRCLPRGNRTGGSATLKGLCPSRLDVMRGPGGDSRAWGGDARSDHGFFPYLPSRFRR